jgi:hypothetical protein
MVICSYLLYILLPFSDLLVSVSFYYCSKIANVLWTIPGMQDGNQANDLCFLEIRCFRRIVALALERLLLHRKTVKTA